MDSKPRFVWFLIAPAIVVVLASTIVPYIWPPKWKRASPERPYTYTRQPNGDIVRIKEPDNDNPTAGIATVRNLAASIDELRHRVDRVEMEKTILAYRVDDMQAVLDTVSRTQDRQNKCLWDLTRRLDAHTQMDTRDDSPLPFVHGPFPGGGTILLWSEGEAFVRGKNIGTLVTLPHKSTMPDFYVAEPGWGIWIGRGKP